MSDVKIVATDHLETDNRRNEGMRELFRDRMEGMPIDGIRTYLEDLRNEYLVDSLTDLGSNKAFLHRTEKEFIAALDVDSLKWVNDNLGHASGDRLLKETASALSKVGLKEDAFHISGDEFFVIGDDKDVLKDKLIEALEHLQETSLSSNGITMKGAGFSFGISTNALEADQRLHDNKIARESDGLRAPRGSVPPGVTGMDQEQKQERELVHHEALQSKIQMLPLDHPVYESVVQKVRESDSEHNHNDGVSQKNEDMMEVLFKPYDQLSDEDFANYIDILMVKQMVDPMTGLGSFRAHASADKKEFVASIDIDSLKWVNDNMGHASGDNLIKETGKALIQAGLKDSAFHISGDEFVAISDNKDELVDRLRSAQEILKSAIMIGNDIAVIGGGFSFGVAGDYESADRLLMQDKRSREINGLRASRGERPAEAFDISNVTAPQESIEKEVNPFMEKASLTDFSAAINLVNNSQENDPDTHP